MTTRIGTTDRTARTFLSLPLSLSFPFSLAQFVLLFVRHSFFSLSLFLVQNCLWGNMYESKTTTPKREWALGASVFVVVRVYVELRGFISSR